MGIVCCQWLLLPPGLYDMVLRCRCLRRRLVLPLTELCSQRGNQGKRIVMFPHQLGALYSKLVLQLTKGTLVVGKGLVLCRGAHGLLGGVGVEVIANAIVTIAAQARRVGASGMCRSALMLSPWLESKHESRCNLRGPW